MAQTTPLAAASNNTPPRAPVGSDSPVPTPESGFSRPAKPAGRAAASGYGARAVETRSAADAPTAAPATMRQRSAGDGSRPSGKSSTISTKAAMAGAQMKVLSQIAAAVLGREPGAVVRP